MKMRSDVTAVKYKYYPQLWVIKTKHSLTCELSQDLLDGHAAGVRVSVGTVGSDQVVGGVDGGFDACCTRFL